MANETSKTTGITFTSALLLVFIILKLTGNIDWSWWWVLSPLWIPIIVVIILFIIFYKTIK